ncbi:hypothetical protein D5086_021167 [Populus alba]|uniref:Uncharacterized protein n=1 Tax=Populus alba TaxID=43335 RepID=A0ACC4BBR6_POPAL
MLKRDHPKIQRQLNFGNRGIEVGMPKLTESKFRLRKESVVEQVAEAYNAQEGSPENFKATEFRQTGASKSECRETHRVKAFRLCGGSVKNKVAEAYMLKRDHPKFKGN